MSQKKLTIPDIRSRKNGIPLSVLTAYDYPWAKMVDAAGIDIVLVGDSLGMVVLGYTDTVSVTMEEMLHHTRAVVRGVEHALVVTDMPFGSYNSSIPAAINNATRILKEGHADAVKLEGGVAMAPAVEAIVRRLSPSGEVVAVSAVLALNIYPAGINKGSGLHWLSRETGIDVAEMAGIGDSSSDVDFLRLVGHPAAPANATADVKAVAAYLSPEADAAGTLDILRHWQL